MPPYCPYFGTGNTDCRVTGRWEKQDRLLVDYYCKNAQNAPLCPRLQEAERLKVQKQMSQR